ncbi:MAG: cation-translocating P-type ATPase [Thermaerobacter sp.]|nr:cation-translocating P-type ATPase [Thermaerobacter sp.]
MVLPRFRGAIPRRKRSGKLFARPAWYKRPWFQERFHCTSCALAVERALARCPGVAQVRAAFATETLRVAFDPALTDVSVLKALIREVGFTAYTGAEAARLAVSPQERDLARRLARVRLGWVLGGPLFVAMVWGWLHPLPAAAPYAMALLTTALQLSLGRVYYAAAWRALRHAHTATTDLLVSLGAGSSFVYSLAGLALGWHPRYFDTSAMVLVLITQGNYLKARATTHSLDSIKGLARLQARYATVARDGGTVQVPVDEVRVGERLLVATGSRVPLDGRLCTPAADLEEGVLTGEAAPVHKGEGDAVWAGTLNVGSPLELEVTAVGQDLRLTRVIRLVLAAQSDRVRAVEITDRLSRWFVPAVLALALVTAGIWIDEPGAALARMVAVMVVACPCALSLAPGTAVAQATARLAAVGILLTRASALERLVRIREVVFDKTGTLTEGHLELVSCPDGHWARVAAALEGASLHPVARALREKVVGERLPTVRERREMAGRGVMGRVEGRVYALGRAEWIASLWGHAVELPEGTAAVLADSEAVRGVFSFTDRLRPGSAETVRRLLAQGLDPIILSGDREPVVASLATALGIARWKAQVSPEEKFAYLQAHPRAAMVGDGVNDAAALAAAGVGVAMGSAADAAAASADLVLTGNDLQGLLLARAAGRAALRVILQNLIYAFGFNAVALPLAIGGRIPPQFAALSMSVSSLLVVGNSLRLRRMRLAVPDAGSGGRR